MIKLSENEDKVYYGPSDWSTHFFVKNIENNIDSIVKHNEEYQNKKSPKTFDNIDDLKREIDFHIFYWNILKFKADLQGNKIVLEQIVSSANSMKNFNENFNEDLVKYENYIFNLIIVNWDKLKNELEIDQLRDYFEVFFKDVFWTKKKLIAKNMNISKDIANFFLSNRYYIFLPSHDDFKKWNLDLKEVLYENIKLDVEKYSIDNPLLVLPELKLYYDLTTDSEYVKKALINILDNIGMQENIYKKKVIERINRYFEKSNIMKKNDILDKISSIKKNIADEEKLNSKEFENGGANIAFGTIGPIEYKEFENFMHRAIDNKGMILYPYISIILKQNIDNSWFIKMFDTGTFNPLQALKYSIIFEEYPGLLDSFFSSNTQELLSYQNQIMNYLKVITLKLHFDKNECDAIESWTKAIFDFYLFPFSKEYIYKFDGALYCWIQAIELLIKKVYLFTNKDKKTMNQLSVPKILYSDDDYYDGSENKTYKFHKLNFLSEETIIMLYLFLYLNDDNENSLNTRNNVMHGDIPTLTINVIDRANQTKMLLIYLIEEIFNNIMENDSKIKEANFLINKHIKN